MPILNQTYAPPQRTFALAYAWVFSRLYVDARLVVRSSSTVAIELLDKLFKGFVQIL